MKGFWITALALASNGLGIAQEPPPPPPLRGDAASLQDTMKFLQDKLPNKVNFMVYRHDNIAGADATFKQTVEVSNVSADVAQCRIDGHFTQIINGETKRDKDFSMTLKQVQEIVVTSFDQASSKAAASAGHPELSFKIDPSIFEVGGKQKGGYNVFLFYDGTLTDRVSKALQHAVDLCGGGNQEPF